MLSYKKINNVTGWIVFFFALVVYWMTVEPTASFWDCGEYIAVSYKLMIPHPPGAPLYLLIGRFFSMFASSETEVAFWVNMVSVISSAFTVLFLFWTITIFARKLMHVSEDSITRTQQLLIMGAGAIGAVAYTFSDSFWFSATEGEVYAISAFFTAFVFWAILKWEYNADKPESDRWLILIAYMMGLSIGVHLLNLVTIPALGLVFYFRKYKPTLGGGIITFIISSVIILIILIGVIPGLPSMAGWFEVLFVNTFGLPFNSGIIFFSIIFLGALGYGIYYSVVKEQKVLNTALLCFLFILVGYGSYALIPIRSQSNPPIDENNPEDVMKVISYLKREQYGDRPLIYGSQFTAEVTGTKDTDPVYRKGVDEYIIQDYKSEYIYESGHATLFPRMYSQQQHHVREYKKLLEKYGGYREGEKPTGFQNLRYMFDRQLGHMYWRYFFWNFVGRSGDVQDSPALWPTQAGEDIPELMESKARNNYYAIPLLLGLIGLFYQVSKDQKNALITGVLFFFTGIAIILYLNAPPIEPRERDYAYAGSYYAFCIWIGLGVIALYKAFANGKIQLTEDSATSKGLKVPFIKLGKTPAMAVAVLLCAIVPVIMGAENWDDHDRSDRYHSVDSAKNLLNSCAKNAIIFTGGDNDTFPLWYAQEVEGVRTDVRVCNLSLLNTDWYIDQMKRRAYESDPLPISLEKEDYISGQNDYLRYRGQDNGKEDRPMYVDKFISALRARHSSVTQTVPGDKMDKTISLLPSKNLVIEFDKDKVLDVEKARAADPDKQAMFTEDLMPLLRNRMQWKWKRNNMEKKDLIMIDMITNIAKNGFDRPIYFSTTLGPSNYLNLKDHMVHEGLAYRLTPVKHGQSDPVINTEIMDRNLMERYEYRELDNPDVYYNENYDRFVFNLRMQFMSLVRQYMTVEKDKKRAKEVLEFCLEKMPDEVFRYETSMVQAVQYLFDMDEAERATEMGMTIASRAHEMSTYQLQNRTEAMDMNNIRRQAYILNFLQNTFKQNDKKEEAEQCESWFNEVQNFSAM